MRETYFDYKQESLDALAKMDEATRKEWSVYEDGLYA